MANCFVINAYMAKCFFINVVFTLPQLMNPVKVHQKLSRELELATESIKNTKAAIVDIISALQQRDLQLAHSLHETDALLQRMESIVPGNKRNDSRAFLTVLVIQNPEAALLSAQRLASTCAAPAGWEPGAPLQSHRPPYPTEDLIRQSGLFALMTQQRAEKRGEPVAAAEDTTQAMTNTTTTSTVAASRRRKAQDKSKLLDLDLNPDM